MSTKLMVVKLTTGDVILAETEYMEDDDIFMLTNPLKVSTTHTDKGESTTSTPYLDGIIEDSIPILPYHIVTMGTANEFYTKFYGGALLKFFSLSISNEEPEEVDRQIKEKKEEIADKYGLIEQIEDERVIH